MSVQTLLRGVYARFLQRRIADLQSPEHIAIVMDGNRRWAREMGLADANLGHRYGAEHLIPLLTWCRRVGVDHVTVFVASTENLLRRDPAEISHLMQTMERLLQHHLVGSDPQWQLHLAGHLDVLPDSTRLALKEAAAETENCETGGHLTLAIGYGGRQEIADAVRDLLHEEALRQGSLEQLAERITIDDIADHLYTAGLPDPDLIIRTSGEMRLSNFLTWQSAGAEFYFCDVYWPGFREIDFLRALRAFGLRKRRR